MLGLSHALDASPRSPRAISMSLFHTTGAVALALIIAFAWGFFFLTVEKHARERDEARRIQRAERDVEEAKTKRFKAKLAGWRNAA